MRDLKTVLTIPLALCLVVTLGANARAQGSADQTGSDGTTVILYPLLVRAPIMGASINLPSVPGIPGGGGDAVSAETDLSFNSAWMAGVSVESSRWFAEGFGLYAALTANRTTPRLDVETNAYLVNGRAGIRLFDGVSATGGLRLVNVKLDATVTLPILGTTLQGEAEKTLWDPLIGVDWRSPLGKRLRFESNVQVGGFGVGTDLEASAEAYLKWSLAKHLMLRAGYTFFYYKYTVADFNFGSIQRTLISKQTLHGPEFGIAIPF
jgi:hypothetical protein